MEAIFARLRIWADKTASAALILNISKWAPPLPVPLENPLVKDFNSAQTITPTLPNAIPGITLPDLRSLYSLSFLVSIQLQSDDPAQRREARKRFAQLHLICPSGPALVDRSLLELGVVQFKENNFEQALAIFSPLDD